METKRSAAYARKIWTFGLILSRRKPSVAFLWDHLGPLHLRRCEVTQLSLHCNVHAFEIDPKSETYDWEVPESDLLHKHTLYKPLEAKFALKTLFLAYRGLMKVGANYVFLCHYDRPEIFLLALLLRSVGVKTYTMYDSKFDDYPRFSIREVIKACFMLPYNGALSASPRTTSYLQFLGFDKRKICLGYDAVDVEVIRSYMLSSVENNDRATGNILIVSRLVPKKNIRTSILAYEEFRANSSEHKRLVICGSGGLDEEIKGLALVSPYAEDIIFRGFLQTADILKEYAQASIFLHLSTEEQFGQVIAEAVAAGLPVICSKACGARDLLVQSGVNGFVCESDNPVGVATFLKRLAEDRALWRVMAKESNSVADRISMRSFAAGVSNLTGVS